MRVMPRILLLPWRYGDESLRCRCRLSIFAAAMLTLMLLPLLMPMPDAAAAATCCRYATLLLLPRRFADAYAIAYALLR